MEKNIFNENTAKAIAIRVQALKPDSKARWGSMNSAEMLFHLNLCNAEIFESAPSAEKTTVKQYLLRILALYVAPDFKKNIQGDPGKDTKGKIGPSCFQEQKARCIALIRRFPSHYGDIQISHIAFGNLSKKQWGVAIFKHVDHHLRQFGV